MVDETNAPKEDDTVSEAALVTDTSSDHEIPPVTIGMSLQAMREYKKLSLEEISAETQISKEKLDNIEKMKFDKPSVFLRGMVKTYAALLGLPAETYAKEYIEAIESKTNALPKKTIIEEASIAAPVSFNRYADRKKPKTVQVSMPMLGAGLAAAFGVAVVIWGLTGTTPPEPTVAKSVLAITSPQNGADQSLLAEVGAAEAASAENINLTIIALRASWIEVRGADGTIFRSRKMAAGESYHPRLGAGWTVTTRDGSAFEWRVDEVSIGKLSEEPAEVFAVSVDQAARQAAEILAPPMVAGTNETQSVR